MAKIIKYAWKLNQWQVRNENERGGGGGQRHLSKGEDTNTTPVPGLRYCSMRLTTSSTFTKQNRNENNNKHNRMLKFSAQNTKWNHRKCKQWCHCARNRFGHRVIIMLILVWFGVDFKLWQWQESADDTSVLHHVSWSCQTYGSAMSDYMLLLVTVAMPSLPTSDVTRPYDFMQPSCD